MTDAPMMIAYPIMLKKSGISPKKTRPSKAVKITVE